MAFIQKLFQPHKYGRQNSRKLSLSETKTDWKKPQFEDNAVRLVLFLDSDVKGRRIIFDSKAVIRADEEKPSKWRKCGQPQKLTCVKEGKVQGNVPNQKWHNYQPTRTGSDGKIFEEIMFGSVGVAYKGTSLKVHIIRSPPQLMLTKVFIPDKPKRCSTASDVEDSANSFSSAPDLSLSTRAVSIESRDSFGIAHSIPMDVPSPKHSWSIDLIDEDSGLASLTSSGSFQAAYPSPGSNASSCGSLNMERRWNRGQFTSLEGFTRRKSQDILAHELTSPSRPKKVKMALGIMFSRMDESSDDANRLFETFFFSHIALFEGHLEKLRLEVEKAYYSGAKHLFLAGMVEAFDRFKRDISDLYTAPRLTEPVWLNMMSFSSYRYMLCDKFLKEFVGLVTKLDSKNTNFFMSTLVTAVLTHHLAWVPTVMPAGGLPSNTYLEKHSAKWVDTLAKSHPYNPLWAQLGDLYGAIGFPLKLSRTVIVGKKADVVKRILYVLSYFIRCSDILETTEHGCLESYLKKAEFAETPSEPDKNFIPFTPTPVNSEGSFKLFGTPLSQTSIGSFHSMKLDSLLSDGDKPDRLSMNEIEKDCNSNNTIEAAQISSLAHSCSTCEMNRNSQSFNGNKVGKSVFYVDSGSCLCDVTANDGDSTKPDPMERSNLEEGGKVAAGNIQKKKENLKLKLDVGLPSPGSLDPHSFSSGENGASSSNNCSTEECKLSNVDVFTDSKVENMQHVRKCGNVDSFHLNGIVPPQCKNKSGLSLQEHANTVLSKEELKAIFQKKGSDSMFNEYFDEEDIETKTIDDVDEKDRVLDLPLKGKHRYFSGGENCHKEDCANKAPSLPDLTNVKTDTSHGKSESSTTRTYNRSRIGSPETYKYRRSSLSRQISETSRPSNNLPGRCRPVTPTELGKRRHVSSTSIDFDFMDPRTFCKEMPMPIIGAESTSVSQKEFNKNFGRSLLADYSDHYLSDFVLHGTSDRNYREKMVRDIKSATQYSVLDEPIAEAVCVVADTDNWTVNVCSSQTLDKTGSDQQPCVSSHLIVNLIEAVVSMSKLKMSPEFCIMHLEDRLQEIYFKSKMLAEYLKRTKTKNIKDVLDMFGFDRSDMPLLVAIAGTHTPNLQLVCLP